MTKAIYAQNHRLKVSKLEYKLCPKCNQYKHVDDFGLRIGGEYYQSYCIECRNKPLHTVLSILKNVRLLTAAEVKTKYKETYPNDKQIRSTNTMLKRLRKKAENENPR